MLTPEDRECYVAFLGVYRGGISVNACSLNCCVMTWATEAQRIRSHCGCWLMHRAQAHMPAEVQSKLAYDQLIRALLPLELKIQVKLLYPQNLQAALEGCRDNMWGVVGCR